MPLSWPELLRELRRIDLLVAAPELGPAPAALSADSRSIVPGAVYVAVRGSQADGHRFVADAVRRGAAAVVVETPGAAGCAGDRGAGRPPRGAGARRGMVWSSEQRSSP